MSPGIRAGSSPTWTRAKSEPLAHRINTPPSPHVPTHGTTNRREHRKKKLHQLQKKQTVLRNLRNGMFLSHRHPPTATDFGATFYRHSQMRRWQLEAQIFFFPHFRLMLCRAQWELEKGGGATVHNSQIQAPRSNASRDLRPTYRQERVPNERTLHICTRAIRR